MAATVWCAFYVGFKEHLWQAVAKVDMTVAFGLLMKSYLATTMPRSILNTRGKERFVMMQLERHRKQITCVSGSISSVRSKRVNKGGIHQPFTWCLKSNHLH